MTAINLIPVVFVQWALLVLLHDFGLLKALLFVELSDGVFGFFVSHEFVEAVLLLLQLVLLVYEAVCLTHLRSGSAA